MRKICTLSIIMLCIMWKANAQNGFSQLIKAGPDNATKLLNAYSEPVFKGFGIGMNSGWHNTAKTKGLFKFDVRISATAAFVPQSAKSFDVTKIGLSSTVRPSDPTQTITPTAAGHTGNGPSLALYDDNGAKIKNSDFQLPGGVSPVYGAPQVQVTVGLPYNTDISVRGMPKIDFGSSVGQVSMVGVGLKHNLIHDIVGKAALVVPFDLAIAAGYTHLNYTLPVEVKPYGGATPKDGAQSTDFSNQQFAGHFNGFNAQVILSKKFLVFTPFVSAVYSTSNTNMTLQGNFPMTTGVDNIITRNPTYTTFTNPIIINEKSINGIQGDIGFQLNLAFFKFYASYTAAQYHSVNAGFGFGL